MISAELNQTRLRGGQRLPLRVVKRALAAVAKELGVKERLQVSIAFVDKKTMKKLNKAYRGKDKITDVLSFALDEEGVLGELILSYEQAALQAKDMKHSTRNELIFLIVHGMLHLFGHDHMRPAEAKRMFAHQTAILKKLKVNPRI